MIDEAFAAWRAARMAGESIVVVAADHATVDALALRARAERVAAGEVEPDGIPAGTQIVGRGDEIVTTRNDRRLLTDQRWWVRNGDRWRVDHRRDDGTLVVAHLDGRGRVVLPAGYAADHVALAYAVTVHKAEGVTVHRAVFLADGATTGEHLYVGMTRGRHDNRVCVDTDSASTGHGHRPPPTPVEVLTEVMHRSSAEISATETLRRELDRAEDPATLRRLHEQARASIDTHAGPDRRPELHHLQRLRADLPLMRSIAAGHQAEVARIEPMIARTRRSLAEAHADLEALTRRRRFRRPDQPAIDETHGCIAARDRYLRRLEAERTRAAGQLHRARRRLDDAKRAVARIPDVEAAIARRREWLLTHPAEHAWQAELATRLVGHIDEPAVSSAEHDHDHAQPELEAALRSDLRTVNLGDRRPRTRLERAVRDALGIARHAGHPDAPRPLEPGHDIDGPDLGP
jgi:hypothetical protein